MNPTEHGSRAEALRIAIAAFPTLREAELHCEDFSLTPNPPVPTLQEQCDQIGEEMLASARRLTNDPEHLAKIKKLLF